MHSSIYWAGQAAGSRAYQEASNNATEVPNEGCTRDEEGRNNETEKRGEGGWQLPHAKQAKGAGA